MSCGTCSCSPNISDSPDQGFGKAEPDQLLSSVLENNLKNTTAPHLKTVEIFLLRNLAHVVPGLFTHKSNSFSCKIHFKANCTMKGEQGRSTRSSGLFWALLNTGTGEELPDKKKAPLITSPLFPNPHSGTFMLLFIPFHYSKWDDCMNNSNTVL